MPEFSIQVSFVTSYSDSAHPSLRTSNQSKPTYTAIPDTSDSNYWDSKAGDRSTTFIPKDKELHQQLKKKAWMLIQASLTKKNRKGSSY